MNFVNQLTQSHKRVGLYFAVLIAAVYLTSVFVVPLSASAYSASPSLTNPKVILRPFTVAAGASVKVTGLGFTDSSTASVTFNGATVASGVVVNSTGGFVTNFVVPSSTSPGSYPVVATDASGKSASNTLTVKSKVTLTITATGHSDGSTVTVSGTQWMHSATITVTFRGDVVATTTSSSSGSFSTQFKIADAPAGTFFIVVTDGTNSQHRAFGVVPRLLASPTSGAPGSMITVNGTGYGQNVVVKMTFGPDSITTMPTTSNTGSFQVQIQIPSGLASGAYTLTATDSSGNTAHTRVSVT